MRASVGGLFLTLAGLALCVPARTMPVAAADRAGDAMRRTVHELLVERWLGDGWSDDQLVGRLSQLGVRAVEPLFAVYAGLDARLFEEAADLAPTGERGPETFAALAGQALQGLPRRDVLRHLAQQARPSAALEARQAALSLLGELGRADEVGLVLELAATFPDLQLRGRGPSGAVRAALAGILAHDPDPDDVLERLTARLGGSPPALRALLLDAILGFDHPAALYVLPDLLDLDPHGASGTDVRVVRRIAELAEAYPWRAPADASRALRRRLQDEDEDLRAASVVALGRMCDLEAFDTIARLLEDDPRPSVRRVSLWALQEISGTRQEQGSDAWLDWYERQLAEWNEQGPELLERLYSDDPAVVFDAVRGLARHTLQRHQAAEAIAGVLLRKPELAEGVVAILVELHSRRAVPVLVEALDSEEVRRVAWGALCELTDRRFPLGDQRWHELVQ